MDDLLLDFVDTKLGQYKKLTDSKVNKLFKRKWFEGYMTQVRTEDSQAAVKVTIAYTLDDLPESITDEIYAKKCDLVYQYVYDLETAAQQGTV